MSRDLVHVTPHLPPDQAANALLPALAGTWARQAGYRVAYLAHPAAQQRDAAPPGALPGDVIWIPRRDVRPSIARTLRIDAWRLAREIGAALDRSAADAALLHLHSNGLLVEVAAAWARRRRIPYALTLYGTEIWHYRRRWPIDPFSRAYYGAAEVTFYSEGLLDHARAAGLDRTGLSVVYPAVPESFQPLDEQARRELRSALGISERALILNVKRLHELAGQRFLLDAFAALARERGDMRLVICGTGGLLPALEAQARALGVADRVTFTGLVPNDTVARYSAAADVFALPSLLEALPTVAVEALASGTPVVSADHPGGVELNGLFGEDVCVVPREQAGPLARALGEALASGRRTRPETAGILSAHFRPAAVAAQYTAMYRRIAS